MRNPTTGRTTMRPGSMIAPGGLTHTASQVGGDKAYTSNLLPADLVKQWEEELPQYPKISRPEGSKESWKLGNMLELVKHFQQQPEQPVHPLFVMRMLTDCEKTMAKKYAKPIHY